MSGAAGRRHHHALQARADWLRGSALLARGEVERANVAYMEAVQRYERAKDNWNLLTLRNTVADGLREAGAHPTGWRYLSVALLNLDRITDLRRKYLVLYNAALYAADTGLPYAALAFQEAALEAAYKRGTANTIVEAHIQRGRRHLALGRTQDAVRDLDEADRRMRSIESPSSREYESAWLARVRADGLASTRPDEALKLVDESLIDYFRNREMTGVPALYLTRGRAALSAGRPREAAISLSDGIQTFEGMYRNIAGHQFRASYLDGAWDLFAELIGLRVMVDRNPDEGLRVAERARTRSLNWVGPADVTVGDVIARLPAGTGLLYMSHWITACLFGRWRQARIVLVHFRLGESNSGVASMRIGGSSRTGNNDMSCKRQAPTCGTPCWILNGSRTWAFRN